MRHLLRSSRGTRFPGSQMVRRRASNGSSPGCTTNRAYVRKPARCDACLAEAEARIHPAHENETRELQKEALSVDSVLSP